MEVCFPSGQRSSITVDSGAEENVCPWDWANDFAVLRYDKRMTFSGANGKEIPH